MEKRELHPNVDNVVPFIHGRDYYEASIKEFLDALKAKFGEFSSIVYDYYNEQLDFSNINSFTLLQINFNIEVCRLSVNMILDDNIPITIFTHYELVYFAICAKTRLNARDLPILASFTTCKDLRQSISNQIIYHGQQDKIDDINIIGILIVTGTQRKVEFLDRGQKHQALLYEGPDDDIDEDDILEEIVCFTEGI